MKKILKISLKSLWCKYNLLFFIIIIIVTAMPTMLFNMSDSMLSSIKYSKKINFGCFTDLLVADNEDAVMVNREIENILWESKSVGLIKVHYSVGGSDSELVVGYADSNAYDLSFIRLIDGRIPARATEVMITQRIAELNGLEVGSNVTLYEKSYIVTGIIANFGRLWPRGELDYSTPNVLLHESESSDTDEEMYSIFLLLSNEEIDNDNFIKNVNGLSDNITFSIPLGFMCMIYLSVFLVTLMVLKLNRKKHINRIRQYELLGLDFTESVKVIGCELLILTLLGALIGTTVSCLLTLSVVKLLLSDSDIFFVTLPNLDIINLAVILIIFACSLLIHCTLLLKRRSEGVKSDSDIVPHKLRLGGADKRIYVTFSLLFISLLSYGIFWGSYFSRDVYEDVPGTMVKDYDFRYTVNIPASSPAQDGEKTFMFTDSSEKLGADEDTLESLLSNEAIDKVNAFKENNKIMVMLERSQIDDYVDGFDFKIDNNYNIVTDMMLTDIEAIYDYFKYESENVLVASKILGYPIDEINRLGNYISEGEINIDKLISGEEIILRVPSYCLLDENGGIRRVTKGMYGYDESLSHSNSTLKVGDELKITFLYSDKEYNGAVSLNEISNFERIDRSVKIGAIISEPAGIFHSNAFPRAYELLTANQAFDSIGIYSKYSVIDIYSNDKYDAAETSNIVSSYSSKLPNMAMDNWTNEVRNYRIFNRLVEYFVIIFVLVIALTAFIFLSSQMYNLTYAYMKYYKLLRINGMSLRRIMLNIVKGSLIYSLVSGILLGIPSSLLLSQAFALNAKSEVLENIFYYFDPINYLYVICSEVIILILALTPCLISLYRTKNNISAII